MKYCLLWMICLLYGCGYMDADGIVMDKRIVGNFSLIQREYGQQVSLELHSSYNSTSGIIQDCKRVSYDSVHQNIYVEEVLSDQISNYYEFHILDSLTTNELEGTSKKLLNKKTFDSLFRNSCLIFSKPAIHSSKLL